ncbi:MAG: FHA domain-containing protein [Propioniciclava sp.]
MKQVRYRPGGWQVCVEDAGIIAAPGELSLEQVTRLSELLRSETPVLTEVIDALAGDGSFTSLGSFAVALQGADGVRFAVRGPVNVRITDAPDGEAITGQAVTTWHERLVGECTSFEITLDSAAGPADAAYPLQSGVVLASAISVGGPADAGIAPPPAVAADQGTGQTNNPSPDPASNTGFHTLVPTDVTLAPEPDAPQPPDAPAIPQAPFPLSGNPADLPAAEASTGVPPELGDHDGATISVAEARRLRAGSVPEASPTPGAQPSNEAAAAVGQVRVSDGQIVALDRPVILGRRPRATGTGGALPHLVVVESPQQDISRNHLEVRPEGDSVVVVDLHTTNGSTLLRPGTDPVLLHPGEATLVLSGDTIDLGDGITVNFQGLA